MELSLQINFQTHLLSRKSWLKFAQGQILLQRVYSEYFNYIKSITQLCVSKVFHKTLFGVRKE